MVRLIRSAGGLGASLTPITDWVVISLDTWLGKMEATWPSGPMPSRQRSKRVSPSSFA